MYPLQPARARRDKFERGFTLVELIIVIIILAILAALAVPQFVVSTDDARQATLEADLILLQKAIQFYELDHGRKLPDNRIVLQLTQPTKGNGEPGNTKSSPYNYGPYLSKFPENPYARGTIDADGVTVVASAEPLSPDAEPTTGWKYSSVTGEIIANVLNAGT